MTRVPIVEKMLKLFMHPNCIAVFISVKFSSTSQTAFDMDGFRPIGNISNLLIAHFHTLKKGNHHGEYLDI